MCTFKIGLLIVFSYLILYDFRFTVKAETLIFIYLAHSQRKVYVVGHIMLLYLLDWTNAGISFILLTVKYVS